MHWYQVVPFTPAALIALWVSIQCLRDLLSGGA